MKRISDNFIIKTVALFTRAMIGAYALSVLLILLANVAIGEANWMLLAFFNSFAHLLWLPALVLILPVILFRQWHLALMLLPIIAVLAWFYAPLFIDQTVVVPSDAQRLTVMTYNMKAPNQNADAIVQLIRDNATDIVALQELSVANANVIDAQLPEVYPHRALYPKENPFAGQGILSRYPIVEHSYWQYDLPTPLGHQRAVIQHDDRQLVVYNVHPTHPGMNGHAFYPLYRYCELADILKRTSQETHPVIWLGDFNMPHLSRDYAMITQNYTDVFQRVGFGMGWTFPVNDHVLPTFLRLDYVFIREPVMAVQARVIPNSAGSDHYPLWAELAYRPTITPAWLRVPPQTINCAKRLGAS